MRWRVRRYVTLFLPHILLLTSATRRMERVDGRGRVAARAQRDDFERTGDGTARTMFRCRKRATHPDGCLVLDFCLDDVSPASFGTSWIAGSWGCEDSVMVAEVRSVVVAASSVLTTEPGSPMGWGSGSAVNACGTLARNRPFLPQPNALGRTSLS